MSELTEGIQRISLVPEAEQRRQRRLPEEERDTLLIEMTRRQAQLVLGQSTERTTRRAANPRYETESRSIAPSDGEKEEHWQTETVPHLPQAAPESKLRNEPHPPLRHLKVHRLHHDAARRARAERHRNRSPLWRRDRRGNSYVRCYRPDDTEAEEEQRRERRAQRRVARRHRDMTPTSRTRECITPRSPRCHTLHDTIVTTAEPCYQLPTHLGSLLCFLNK